MIFNKKNSIKNYVFDGTYSIFDSPFDKNLSSFWESKKINPSGVVGTLVYYHKNPSLDDIQLGYYASGSGYFLNYISGASENKSDSKGYIYYRISTPLFGVCHGFGNDYQAWLNGYNFYNAFHPEGFISPPFGQQTTVFKSNSLGIGALYENGNCSPLKVDEYNDIFGIVSSPDDGIQNSTDDVIPGVDSLVNSPAIACPQDLSVTYYWREKQYKIIAGTAGAISANTFFNTNPIPTSLDAFDLRTQFRYSASGKKLEEYVDGGDGKKIQKIKYDIKYDENGKPLPGYSAFGGKYVLNNFLCLFNLAESTLSKAGTQVRSQLLDAPDILGEPSKSKFDAFNWWNTWHFLFKENSNGFPFTNDYASLGDVGLGRTTTSSNYGSQLFKADLASETHYWENRQCPATVDFLPYTFGASIYACPSHHFDVPYYAAINKFGFYGTRFLNGCVSLQLDYPSSGYPETGAPNAQELDINYSYVYPEEQEPDEDKGINYSNTIYDNLLKIAKVEESTNDFFGLNKLFFLWNNFSLVSGSQEYSYLTGRYPNLDSFVNGFFGEYEAVFPSGKNHLLINNHWFQSEADGLFYDTGLSYKILSNNENYKFFKTEIKKIFKKNDEEYWNEIEKKYALLFLNSQGLPDTGFYYEFQNSKIKRFQARYLENIVKGNAIDLYPSNKITFGVDKAKDYIESPSWGKLTGVFGSSTKFFDTGLNRRYFIGSYIENNDFNQYNYYINSFNQIKNSYFYPGFFHSKFGSDVFKDGYVPVITGNIFSGESVIDINTIKNGENPLAKGWLALGYNGISKLRDDYSCFTPIFVQQPLPFVYCKIGQSPTFRSFAVDYHTIPEDKINDRYPEIRYWTKKLKITDSKDKNRYPLSYKWFRVKKSDYNYNFQNFLLTGYFSVTGENDFYHNPSGNSSIEPSSITGNWCCLEGDGPFCTLIHPKECVPPFSGNSSFSYKYIGSPMYEEAKRNNFYMDFKKGTTFASGSGDNQYYYFCVAKGRFGIRISEPSELLIDNVLKFDVSIQNGGNVSLVPTVQIGPITISGSPMKKYGGFVNHPSYIPESVVEMQIPPPNRGFGDVYSYRFVGPWGYGGAFQSYTPGTLKDTRGLKEIWGRFLHYGPLSKYEKVLSQEEGDYLYGRSAFLKCKENQSQITKWEGIPVTVYTSYGGKKNEIKHWTSDQIAIISLDGRRGVKWNKLGNAGELYNPVSDLSNGKLDGSPTPGLGQWQWGNNLGGIHQLPSWDRIQNKAINLVTTPKSIYSNILFPELNIPDIKESDFNKLKEKLFTNPGIECHSLYPSVGGLGRNMLYWIEGFSSFYLYCDPLKKKNITNYNYMNPGLRYTNSNIQFFWLGQPSNAYLKRYPMFGPYAYQWKVMRHNRDRNGNGMSEGFYSYGWNTNYSLMYDAPAIYGFFRRYGELNDQEKEELEIIKQYRKEIFKGASPGVVRNNRFGFTYGNGGALRYGNIWVGNLNEEGGSNPTGKAYVKASEKLASNPKFHLYSCSDEDLIAGECFDPCISIRYQNGFIPGGKKQRLNTALDSYAIVPNNISSGSSFYEETAELSGSYFRGPFGTPHHQHLKNYGVELNGFSPCFDGGSDHCNYITPTINLGGSSYLTGQSLSFIAAATESTLGLQL